MQTKTIHIYWGSLDDESFTLRNEDILTNVYIDYAEIERNNYIVNIGMDNIEELCLEVQLKKEPVIIKRNAIQDIIIGCTELLFREEILWEPDKLAQYERTIKEYSEAYDGLFEHKLKEKV